MTRKALAILAVTGVVALVAAGCGGGDSSSSGSAGSEGQEYVDAIVAGFNESDEPEDVTIPEEDARCAGERFVDILGVDRLEAAGVTPEQLQSADSLTQVLPDIGTEEADQLVDAIYECIDVQNLFVAGFTTSAGVTLPEEKLECLGSNFENSERLRDAFGTSIITGEDPDFASDTALITEILGDCLTVEDLVEIGQQSTGE